MALDYGIGLGNADHRSAFLLKDFFINVFYNYCYFYSLEVFLKKYKRD